MPAPHPSWTARPRQVRASQPFVITSTLPRCLGSNSTSVFGVCDVNNRAFGFAAAIAATIGAIDPAAAAELVTNGGFEDGFSGWTQTGNSDYSGVGGGVVTDRKSTRLNSSH